MTSLRDVGETLSNAVMENVGRAMSRAQERTPLPVDLLESEDAYLAVFDAPGATSSDVQVRFSDRTVEVRIDRFREFHEGFEMRVPGRGLSLDGQVTLPEGAVVEADEASATLYDNGTLQVRIPKGEAETTVDVEEGDSEDEHVAVDDEGEEHEAEEEHADDHDDEE